MKEMAHRDTQNPASAITNYTQQNISKNMNTNLEILEAKRSFQKVL